MQFSLTYTGEHYVADGIAGALCAVAIEQLARRVERRERLRDPSLAEERVRAPTGATAG